MNPAAAERNLHHTLSGWRSEQEMWEELQRDHAEAEYFAHVENPHNYPQITPSSILISNEPISTGKLPF